MSASTTSAEPRILLPAMVIDTWLQQHPQYPLDASQRADFDTLLQRHSQHLLDTEGPDALTTEVIDRVWPLAWALATNTVDLAALGDAYWAQREALYTTALLAVLANVPKRQVAKSSRLSRPTIDRMLRT